MLVFVIDGDRFEEHTMKKHYLRLIVFLSWALWMGMSVAAWAQDGIVNARGN